MMKSVDNAWGKWKTIRDTDPVKARLYRVLFFAGILILPFLTVWVWKGLAQAMAMVGILALIGIGLIVAALAVNFFFGWAAHYVFTGNVPPFDNWLDYTILDELDRYQQHKNQPHHAAHIQPVASAPQVAPEQPCTNRTPHSARPQFDNGPDWIGQK